MQLQVGVLVAHSECVVLVVESGGRQNVLDDVDKLTW